MPNLADFHDLNRARPDTLRLARPGAIAPLRIPAAAKERVRLLFVAKHALGGGAMHPEDGNHAVYHHEIRTTLESLGLNLQLADSYEALFERPAADFVFPLLNRGGFVNSEMLLPLLCNRHALPYLGAMPFLRGLSDDKATSKIVAAHSGVRTAPWFCFRRGAPVRAGDCPPARGGRWVIKPNASSASWGISDAHGWPGVAEAVARIHAEGHDAIVEPYLDGYDVQVPFITLHGEPVQLPILWYDRQNTARLWTYQEKRDLAPSTQNEDLKPFTDARFAPQIGKLAAVIARHFAPFDYGRIEFRLDPATGEVTFIELNLNCNLWSQKSVATAARLVGFSHADLLETLLAEAWRRNGLLG